MLNLRVGSRLLACLLALLSGGLAELRAADFAVPEVAIYSFGGWLPVGLVAFYADGTVLVKNSLGNRPDKWKWSGPSSARLAKLKITLKKLRKLMGKRDSFLSGRITDCGYETVVVRFGGEYRRLTVWADAKRGESLRTSLSWLLSPLGEKLTTINGPIGPKYLALVRTVRKPAPRVHLPDGLDGPVVSQFDEEYCTMLRFDRKDEARIAAWFDSNCRKSIQYRGYEWNGLVILDLPFELGLYWQRRFATVN